MLELVEWRVVLAVLVHELLLEPLELALIVDCAALGNALDLACEFLEVGLAPLDVLLGLEQKDLLLLVVMLHRLGQRVLPVLEHFDHQFQLLVELLQRVLFRRLPR